MRATVVKEFPGRADDATTTRIFRVGETITGDLAAVAVREGWADEHDVDLSKLSRKQLDELAGKQGIDTTGMKTKAEVLAALAAGPAA